MKTESWSGFHDWMDQLWKARVRESEMTRAARAYGLRESAWRWAEVGVFDNANLARDAAELLHGYDDVRLLRSCPQNGREPGGIK